MRFSSLAAGPVPGPVGVPYALTCHRSGRFLPGLPQVVHMLTTAQLTSGGGSPQTSGFSARSRLLSRILTSLIPLDSQLCLLNSGGLPGSPWGHAPCTTA